MDVNHLAWAYLDTLPPRQLLIVERRATGDEEINLDLALLVNQVGRSPRLDGTLQRVLGDVELGRQRRDQWRHVSLCKRRHKIDVDG